MPYTKEDEDKYTCPDCEGGGNIVLMQESNYGADADGRRGICIKWLECYRCGYQPPVD